jgi:hypothetical protein
MSEIKDGGPAFPVPYHPEQQWENPAGMSLRDYFAAKAMQGMILLRSYSGTADQMAGEAYVMADAMLAARGAA